MIDGGDGGLSRDAWCRLVDDVTPATFGELCRALEDHQDVGPDRATELLENAIGAGHLVERETGGAFLEYAVSDEKAPEDGQSGGANPTLETGESPSSSAGGKDLANEPPCTPLSAELPCVSDADRSTNDETTEGVDGAEPLGSDDTTSVRHTSNSREDAGSHLKNDGSEGKSRAKVSDKRRTLDSEDHTADQTVDREKAREAFEDILEFFHRKLDVPIDDHTEDGEHPERPTTAREYFQNRRGWSDEIIDTRRLGWAPPNAKDELVAWLFDRGHDRDAMLATGVIGESDTGGLYVSWKGRYVLPYFDRDGRPAYAIARCTGDKGGGGKGYDGHPADYQSGKYSKVRHTDERVPFTEPIFGLDTLEDGEPVVVAEGMPDAISALEAGYTVLSPVAKEFKREHILPLRDAITGHDIPAVYIVPDADPVKLNPPEDAPDDPESIGDALEMPLVPDGLAGALRSATLLEEAFDNVNDETPDVRVADLPQPSAEKIDLDDYLKEWADDLNPVLASAKPATAFNEYDRATRHMDRGGPTDLAGAEDMADDRTVGEAADRSRSVDPADPHRSSLWALDMADVTPVGFSSVGDRGRNPAAHKGNSEAYFVLREGRDGDLVASDYKGGGGKAKYNALTYLLVDADERDRDRPEGSLSDREVWLAWKHARESGVLPLKDDDGDPLPDPIPLRALWHVAREHGLADPEDIPDDYDDDLPDGALEDALDVVRDEYCLEPEREMDGPDAEPTAALALARLEALDAGQRERYRHSLPHGVGVPTTDEVSTRIRDAVESTLRDEGYSVLQAPTGGNKTGVGAETHWRDVDNEITGGRPVVLFSETVDARNEAIERADEAGLEDVKVFKGYTELCEVARGDYDPANIDDDDPDAPEPILIDGDPASEWFAERVERRGVPISVVHSEFEDLLRRQGREPPCCEGPYTCGTKTQWPEGGLTDEYGPRYDLVIATDPFAYVPSLRQETNIIHDEQPTYEEDFGLESPTPDAVTGRVRCAVTAFLGLSDDGPDTFEALVELARECARCDAAPWNEHAPPGGKPGPDLAERWYATFDALEHEPGRRWYFTDSRAHTLAPALAKAIWKAITDDITPKDDPDERGAGVFDVNGRAKATVSHTPPRLDDDARDDDGWNRTLVTLTIDDENTVRTVRNVPDFQTARSVVGLDARPTGWLWQRNVHADMTTERVLDRDETRLWRRYERGQTVAQIGDATRPAGKEGKYFNECHARAVVEKLRDHFGDEFDSVGTAKALESANAGEHVNAGFRELLLEAGAPEDDVDEFTMTYGEEKSRNDFAEKTTGLVYSCIDPGDDYVLDLLAECGLDARPERGEECNECDGDGCHKCDGTGQKRAHGRGFVGPDADHATELLESVRATHVAQMIGRFGRSLDVEKGETNLTFVATNAVPEDLVDYQVPGVEWLATALHREILTELSERPSATARELADAVGCSKEHVRQTLERLEGRDVVRRRRRVGEHGADVWSAGETGPIDDVQLRLDQITNSPVQGSSTWELAVSELGAERDPPKPTNSTNVPGTETPIAPERDGPPPG